MKNGAALLQPAPTFSVTNVSYMPGFHGDCKSFHQCSNNLGYRYSLFQLSANKPDVSHRQFHVRESSVFRGVLLVSGVTGPLKVGCQIIVPDAVDVIGDSARMRLVGKERIGDQLVHFYITESVLRVQSQANISVAINASVNQRDVAHARSTGHVVSRKGGNGRPHFSTRSHRAVRFFHKYRDSHLSFYAISGENNKLARSSRFQESCSAYDTGIRDFMSIAVFYSLPSHDLAPEQERRL